MKRTTSGALPRSMLGVWAHPDDEAYLSAGLMAAMRSRGRRVTVVTATRGEHGTPDPTRWPPHRLLPVRERELSASLAAVGVDEHHWLRYRDGTLADVDPAAGAADIADVLAAVRPEVVVTFGPDGVTGHSDHQAISEWVSRACEEISTPPRIWHATLTPEFHRRWGALNESVGVWMDPSAVPSTPSHELVWSLPRSRSLRSKKYAALRAHASQTGPLISLVGGRTYRAWWSGEYFVELQPAAHCAYRVRSTTATSLRMTT